MMHSGSPSCKRRKLNRGSLSDPWSWRPYQYDSLEGSDDIRIIILLPGHFHDKVRFEFFICNLEDAPDYEALSYTWRDSDEDQSLGGIVFCEPGFQKISVTENCELALRRLRLQDEIRFLWVDAICISQSFVQERNRQVYMMPKIYSSASRVIVYLGEGTSETDDLLDFLNKEPLALDKAHKRGVPSGASLFSRRWFTRLWILQEIALARAARVICGNKTTAWQKLSKYYLQVVSRKDHLSDFQEDHLYTFLHLDVVFEEGLKGIRPMDFLPHLFSTSQRHSCSDPRDRVFALLRIVSNNRTSAMMPEYGASNATVFKELAIHFLKEFKLLFLDREFVQPANNWPSWVFDWSQPRVNSNYLLAIDTIISIGNFGDDVSGLEILGRRVLYGTVCHFYSRSSTNTHSLVVVEGLTYVIKAQETIPFKVDQESLRPGISVVEVSEGSYVLLLQKGDFYSLRGGITNFQRNPSLCEFFRLGMAWDKHYGRAGEGISICSRSCLQLDYEEPFIIV